MHAGEGYGTFGVARLFGTLLIVLVVSAAPSQAQTLAWVANFGRATPDTPCNVAAIDTATNAVVAIIDVDCSPINVAVTPNGAFVYVANGTSSVDVISASSGSVTTIPLASGTGSWAVAITSDGAFAYVAGGSSVSVISTATNSVVASIPLPISELEGISVTPDGALVYVTAFSPPQVFVINTASNTLMTTINTGGPGIAIAISPDGAVAYVTDDVLNLVSVIDTKTNSVIATIPVDNLPTGLAITPDGKFVYVSANHNVDVIDTTRNTVIAAIPVSNGTITVSQNVAITPNGAFVYVSTPSSTGSPGTVTVISTASNSVVSTVSVGIYPYGIAINGASIMLMDPVPKLLTGASVTSNTNLLATNGRFVRGVAADGVTQLVLRIPAATAGNQFTLSVINDQGQASSSLEEDGGLGVLGQNNFFSQITTTAVNTIAGPMAFALYVAPVDFSRLVGGVAGSYKSGTCGNQSNTDDQLACRSVSIRMQSSGASTTSLAVTILRPPVILVHGLWDDSSTWNNFAPLFINGVTDPRFSVGRADYSYPIGGMISGTSPIYPSNVLLAARANALGFAFNAPRVLKEVQSWIQAFKNGNNPQAILVAAVQADMVAHSMGGDITRTFALEPSFLSNMTFGQGNLHKIITIDTPHLGTPVATQLLSTQNGCVQFVLASQGDIALDSVTMVGKVVTGAVGDLQGDGVGGGLSTWLQNIANPGQHLLPTALIAGVVNSSNLDSLTNNGNAEAIRALCGAFLNNPLATDLTPQGWPSVFGQPSDAMVPQTSELNNLNPSLGFQFFGFIHSVGVESLGFAGPSVLQGNTSPCAQSDVSNCVPLRAINLLNTPVTNAVFNLLNP